MISHKPVLTVERLSKIYGDSKTGTLALDGMSFNVLSGEFLAIMGPSGSGKTTLLNCIATMIRPTAGKIMLNNTEITALRGNKLAAYRGRQLGYLFQEFELLDNLTARENIQLPLALHGLDQLAAGAALADLSGLLAIDEVLDHFPAQMSSGQKQRVAAARALIADPELLLADEPTGSLDSRHAKILMDQLALINSERQKTILMVTHAANVASYANRVLFIQDGRLYHELRRDPADQKGSLLYEQIVRVLAQLGGGSSNVL